MLESRPMRVRLGCYALLLASVQLLGGTAHAQERTDPAAADELFREGRAASEQHDYLTACAKFRESNRLDPAVGTLFNIADCEDKLGRLATAWTLFQEVAQRLPVDDDRRVIAQKRAQTLESRLPKLSVHLAPSGRADVTVRRDGVVLGRASLDTPLPVNPGEHVVVVVAPGIEPAQFRASVGEGERAQITVALGNAASAAGATPTSPAGAAHADHTAAYVLGGVGLAGLITGLVAGVSVLSRKGTVRDNCMDHVCNQTGKDAADSGKTLGVVTTVGFIAGALGLGTATYLFVSAPAPTKNPHSGAYALGIRATW